MLRAEGLVKHIGSIVAVDQVTIQIPTGDMVGIIGRSGAGKSTFLRLINRSIAVKADSPYQSLDDLKSKSLAFADPNSTSGFVAPSYFLREDGINPESYFGRTGLAGSHENGILAVLNSTYDAAATSWTNEERSNVSGIRRPSSASSARRHRPAAGRSHSRQQLGRGRLSPDHDPGGGDHHRLDLKNPSTPPHPRRRDSPRGSSRRTLKRVRSQFSFEAI